MKRRKTNRNRLATSRHNVAEPNVAPGSPNLLSKRWRLAWLVAVLVVGFTSVLGWGLPMYGLQQARRATQASEFDRAGLLYDRVNWLWPRSAAVAIGKAQLARRTGDATQARAMLSLARVYGGDAKAIERERTLLKIQGGGAEQLKNLLPALLLEYPEFGAEVFEAYVIGFGVLGRHEQALSFAQQWIDAAPNDAQAWRQMAESLEAIKQFDRSENAFRQAIQLDPRLIEARQGFARMLMADGRHEEALVQFDEVIQRAPNDVQSRLMRCQSLFELRRVNDALDELRSVLRIDPDSFSARHRLATTMAERGDGDEVVAVLQPLMKEFPDDASINYLLATAYSQMGEPTKADAHLQRHLDGNKRLDEAAEAMGELEFKESQGSATAEDFLRVAKVYLKYQWDEAEPILGRAMVFAPESSDILRAMSEFERKRGNHRRASDLQKAASSQDSRFGSGR